MPLQNGQTLGHYRILRPLGAGGMGEVYEAEDTKLGRKVALKVLPEETSRDPNRRERFAREAKAIAALNHPGIVTIHSVEQAGGVDFITMELLEGQTLRRVLPATGMPFERFLALAVPLADALAAAHERGITHRDLKPENILIGRDGRPKVVDFGLAKADGAFGSDDSGSRAPTRALTEEGRIVGTVAYMSPEQAEGKPVDPRSDVFALGIIFYEMCTGERPFKGETTVSLLSSILKDTPPPVTQSNATLPRDVARIVNRCLMKDPARRFQSAAGVATELTELKRESDSGELLATGEVRRSELATPGSGTPGAGTSGAGTSGAGTSGAGTSGPGVARGASGSGGAARMDDIARAGGAPGRGRALWWAGFAAAAVGSVVAGFVLLRDRKVPPMPVPPAAPAASALPVPGAPRPEAGVGRQRIVVLPFENLGAADDAYFADGVSEEITSRLASVGGLGVISRASAVQYAKTSKSTKEIGAELGVDYVLSGTVRWQREGGGSSRVRVSPQLVRVSDDTQVWGDRFDREMKDIFKVQSEIAEQVVGKLGLAMREPGGSPAAVAAAAEPPTANLEAYQLYLRGKAEIARPELDHAIALQGIAHLEEAVRLDPKFAQGWAALSYGHSLVQFNRVDSGVDHLARARECVDRALALQPGLREGHLALGYYHYWGRRDYTQAAAEFRLAAGGREDDPEALAAMAYMMRRQGKWDEALAAMERAWSLNPRDVQLVGNLAGTYQSLGRYREARRFNDLTEELVGTVSGLKVSKIFLVLDETGDVAAARAIAETVDLKEAPDVAFLLAYLDALAGRYQEALARLDGIRLEALDTQGLYRPKPLLEGGLLRAMGDRKGAATACEAARRFLEKKITAASRDPRLHAALGYALACLGRRDEAVRQAKQAIDLMPVTTDAVDGPAYLEGLALVYATLGDADAAIDVLERVLRLPGASSRAVVRIDPAWAPIRSNPRFAELLKIAR